MEALEKQTKQQDCQEAHYKTTYVLCPQNLSKSFWHAPFNVRHCATCEYYGGLTQYSESNLPKLICNCFELKMLEFYVPSCKKYHRLKKVRAFCQRCDYFKGIDTETGQIICSIPFTNQTNSKVSNVLLPNKEPFKTNYPFQIPCAKTEKTCSIDDCMHCLLFNGIANCRNVKKILCRHSKALPSSTVKPIASNQSIRTKSKTKPPLVSLRWLFDGRIVKSRSVKIMVACILDKTLEDCRQCVDFKGLNSFCVNCATFAHTPIFISKCPQSRSSKLISNCIRCPHFEEIEQGSVRCSWSRLKDSTKLSKMTNKPKFYYGSDEDDR